MWGLVFFSGKKKIAEIGFIHPDDPSTMIELDDGEKWVGVSSSMDDGFMNHFQLITARLE